MTDQQIIDRAEDAALRLLADLKRPDADVGTLVNRTRQAFGLLHAEVKDRKLADRQAAPEKAA
jgi:hypothetical protein